MREPQSFHDDDSDDDDENSLEVTPSSYLAGDSPRESLGESLIEPPINANPKRYFRWKYQDRCPYKDFREEFMESPQPLSPRALKIRWEGIAQPWEIDEFFRRPDVYVARNMQQVKSLRDTGFDASNRDWQKLQNNKFVFDTLKEIDTIIETLESGLTEDAKMSEQVERDEAGEVITNSKGYPVVTENLVTFLRPLRVDEFVKLQKELDEKRRSLLTLTGQATEISQQSVDVGVTVGINEQLREALKQNDPEYARLEAIKNGDAGRSLPHRTFDSEATVEVVEKE